MLKKLKKIYPSVIRIEPASACNLACSHCPTGLLEMKRGLMQTTTFDKILENILLIKTHVRVLVLYHGGEPLLNKNLFQQITQLRGISKDFKIKTVTNGMALNKKNTESVLKCGLDEIEISLDGISADHSQRIRQKSDSAKILDNIAQLLDHRERLGVDIRISISSTQFLTDANAIPDSLNCKPQTPEWLTSAFGDRVHYKCLFAMKWPGVEPHETQQVRIVDEPKKMSCDHVVSSITIRSDGTIVPCCFDLTSKLPMGNIHFQSIEDVYNGPAYQKLRLSIENKNFNEFCNDCSLVNNRAYLVEK